MQFPMILISTARAMGNLSIQRQQSALYGACLSSAGGAGVLYSGYLMRSISASPRLLEWLSIGDKPIACCMLAGYPAVSYRRTAPRRKADVIWK